MKTNFVIGALLFLVLAACKKNKEHCWQVYDSSGNAMGIVCDKTESEIQEAYGRYYDRADAQKFCWKINYSNGTTGYTEELTEKMMTLWYTGNGKTFEKIACGYCQTWSGRQKVILKATGQISYGVTRVERFCGDTCATLYAGRLVVLKETADSLVYHEFVQKY